MKKPSMQSLTHWLLAALVAGSAVGALAQARPDTRVSGAGAGPSEERCRKDVRDYLNAMSFVRESAGNGIGEKVAAVPEVQLQERARSQGFCAAAQLLRDKGVRM